MSNRDKLQRGADSREPVLLRDCLVDLLAELSAREAGDEGDVA